MTTEQRTTYQKMRLVRSHLNDEGINRHELEQELEALRKSLGGFQYAEAPREVAHKPVFEYRDRRLTESMFRNCPECGRFLHYSVISDMCYSCGRGK